MAEKTNHWKNDYARYKDFFLNILRVYKARPDLKSFLEIILSISAVLIFSIFAIKPTALTIIELRKEIQGKEDTVLKLTQKIKSLQTASSVLEQNSASLKFVKQAVPDKPEVEVVVNQVQGYANISSVEILSISSSEVLLWGKEKTKKTEKLTLPQDSKELPITISVTGDYQNLAGFLKNIEVLRRPIKIDTFTINSSQTENGTVLVMIITGRLPYGN